MTNNVLTYSPRAFQQDAQNAMKGDIVRGLIEAITNADDAYRESPGKIRVEVERRRQKPWNVIIKDRAGGMSATRMKEALGTLGGRTSGFEQGHGVRGNLGRDAKDLAAFGPVTFESIRDGRYAALTLHPDASYADPTDRSASQADYDRLGIKRNGSGTVVTIEVRKEIHCPLHDNLIERLAKNYQLRDIVSDPRRDVTLVNLNSNSEHTVRYNRPSLQEVLHEEIELPGYEPATARLTIWRNPECYDNARSDPGRPEGILVVGRRAIYENTLFRFEGRPYSGWFSGRVECPLIDELARDYDERVTNSGELMTSNPAPIISRSRDGLEHSHPLYLSLSAAVEARLAPLIAAEEEKAKSEATSESPRMRRTFHELVLDLGKLIDEDLREMEADPLKGEAEGDADTLLRIIPGDIFLYMGEEKTISVVVSKQLGVNEITAEVDPEGIVEILGEATSTLLDHPRNSDYLIGRFRLRPLVEDEETFLTVTAGEEDARALVEVRAARFDPEPQPPVTLQFEHQYYQLTAGKRRLLELQAPLEVVNQHGAHVRVASLFDGLAVMHGGEVSLNFDEDLLFYRGSVEVDPRVPGEKGIVRAQLGELTTQCVASVTTYKAGPQIEIKILDKFAGKFRAEVVSLGDGTIRMEICGRHPVLKRYLGPAPEFPHQEKSVTRSVLAEIIASEAARFVVERKYPNSAEMDGAEFYHEHRNYLEKYLIRCHKMMLSDIDSTN